MIKDREYIVYMHISPTNKIYVGITGQKNVKFRWCRGSSYKGCKIFYRAIQKYGWDNFQHIVLCHTTSDRAKIMEITLIKYYKSLCISYNITDGGEGQLGNHLSEEARRKIGEKNREHFKGYISRKCVEAGRLYNLGRKHSKERIEKMRQGRLAKGGWKKMTPDQVQNNIERNLCRSHPVLQFDLQENLLKEYRSVKYASEEIKCSRGSLISALTGRNGAKTCKGFIWKYKEDYDKECQIC